MSSLLIEILNLSFTTSFVATIVILIRFLIRKMPKKYAYMLWAVVFIRFICPIAIQLPISAVPIQPQTIPQDIIYSHNPSIQSDLPVVDNAVNNIMERTLPPADPMKSVNPIQAIIKILSYIWVIGILMLISYSIISYLQFKKQIRTAIRISNNIYETDLIKTPFVLGFISPKIYIPTSLSENELEYIIKHEQTHIKRFDYLIKPLAFLITAVHWFNPMAWISYTLMARDMELSADENVMKYFDVDIRKEYSNSLLSLSIRKNRLLSPLAFGETGVKERVKNVLNYKKPTFWVSTVAVLVVISSSVLLVISKENEILPKNEIETNKENEKVITEISPTHDEITETLPTQEYLPDNEYSYNAISNGKEYYSSYDNVKLTLDSGAVGIDSKDIHIFETSNITVISYIDIMLNVNGLNAAENVDTYKNYIDRYIIELSDKIGGFSCGLYYDTLNNKAYLGRDGGLYEIEVDFARYVRALLEYKNIDTDMESYAVDLFKKYGWTLDYKIGERNYKIWINESLLTFTPSIYYFAYNNELSKDIGLDMSTYEITDEVNIEIYRIHESMPQEFYPIQDARGIVVKYQGKIIGAYISAGRHSTFNACSLKGNSIETIIGNSINGWLTEKVVADPIDEMLSKLTPKQVIEEYFKAINNLDVKTARASISRKTLLRDLTANIPNDELYNEGIGLPLTGDSLGSKSSFDNLKSAKLLNVELIEEPDKDVKKYRVTVDLQYHEEIVISNGEQDWDITMTYENAQTGWKIEEVGH